MVSRNIRNITSGLCDSPLLHHTTISSFLMMVYKRILTRYGHLTHFYTAILPLKIPVLLWGQQIWFLDPSPLIKTLRGTNDKKVSHIRLKNMCSHQRSGKLFIHLLYYLFACPKCHRWPKDQILFADMWFLNPPPTSILHYSILNIFSCQHF